MEVLLGTSADSNFIWPGSLGSTIVTRWIHNGMNCGFEEADRSGFSLNPGDLADESTVNSAVLLAENS